MLKKQHQEKKLIAAICGGPIALKAHCIPADTVTSHPSARNMLENAGGSIHWLKYGGKIIEKLTRYNKCTTLRQLA